MQPQLPTPATNTQPNPIAVIQSLLTALKITRVAYIDDCFETNIDFINEHLAVGIQSEVKRPKIEEYLPTIAFDEEEIWRDEMKAWWAAQPNSKHKELTDYILSLKIIPDQTDRKAAHAVKRLIPDSIAYEPVSPQEWDDNYITWFTEADSDHKILCLFDQQFTYTPAVGGARALNGLDMLENAVKEVGATAEGFDGRALFGILSHQFSIDEERATGISICANHNLPLNIFLPLSKKRAVNSTKLAEGIQMLVLNLYAHSLKKLIKEVMSAACQKASTDLDNIDVFAFEDMILRSSIGEGVWEGETLVRIFSLLQQEYGRESIASQETAAFFNSQVEIARTIASPRLATKNTSSEMLRLRRLELYHPGDTLNKFHTPLRLGDIFKSTVANRSYILLAPPCDLMVRSSDSATMGKRGKKPSELQYVELFRIHDVSPRELAGLTPSQQRVTGVLQHYKTNKAGRISFKERVVVPIHVLDLAVLDEQGLCQLDLQNISAVPVQFHAAWRSRVPLLVEYFKELTADLDSIIPLINKPELSTTEKNGLKNLLDTRLNFNSNMPSQPTYTDGKLDFQLQRVDHYRYVVSQHLLNAYTSFLSRPAEEHDFSAVEQA